MASARSAKDESVVAHSKGKEENTLLAAMHRQGLTAPRPANQVRAVLKKKGMTKPKVDRSTIYIDW